MFSFDHFVVMNRTDAASVLMQMMVQLAGVAHHHGDWSTVRVGQRRRRRVQMTSQG